MTELFLTLIKPILVNESGYNNDPDDDGKETYRGISRAFHPEWKGWDTIDEHKELNGPIPRFTILQDSLLDKMVLEFYYEHFYKKLHIDLVKDYQKALNILDFAVTSWKEAIYTAQKVVKVKEDGVLGKITAKAIEDCGAFVERYKNRRTMFYMNLATKKPKNQKYLKGWLKRVKQL